MKIAHIVSTYPPYKGGIGNVCYYQVVELAKKGHKITIFTPNYSNKKILPGNDLPLKVIRLSPIFKYGNAAFIPQLLYKLRDFDIIHIHYPFLGVEFLYLLKIFLKKNVKIILQYQMDLVGKGWLKFIFTTHRIFILPIAISFSDKIIVSSWDYFKNSVIYKYYKKYPHKFIELPNGVDLNKFYPQNKDQELLNRYNLEKNNKILLFVGGLDKAHYFKGIEILLRAIKSISNIKLLIVSDGDLKNYYISLSDKLGIRKRVVFVGKVSDEDLVKYYNLCDTFVLPSIDKSEAFGLVLLEAMACAKAAIASNLPGVRTLIKDNINGLLANPNNSHDLVQKIKYLFSSDNLNKQFGRKSFEIASQRYSWETITNQLIKIYKCLSRQ